MKIVKPALFPPFDLYSERINAIIIENKRAFYEFAEQFCRMCGGADGDIVLSEDNTPLKISDRAEVLTTLVPFEMNNRKLLTKLFDKLKKTAVSEYFYEKTQEINSLIAGYLYALIGALDCEIEMRDCIDLGTLFKSAELCFSDDYSSPAEKLVEYMLNVREILGERLFVLVNLTAYLDRSALALLFETITSHRLMVLIVESAEFESPVTLNRLLIDADYCVI